MSELQQALETLRDDLRASGALDVSFLHEGFAGSIEDAFGEDEELAGLVLEEEPDLPADLRSFCHAVLFADCARRLLDDIASDGLPSIFYNWTTDEIAVLLGEFRRATDPASPLLDRAHAVAAAKLELDGESNWITRNEDDDPLDALGDDGMAELEKIESQMEDDREPLYERAVAALRAAV